ncbi:MAG: hypothetical protein ABUL60_09395 [Myxococcales bacterium]
MSERELVGDDAAFERLLLGAGRADALRHEQAEAALVRFTAGLAALQGGVGAAVGGGAAAGGSRDAWLRFVAAAKWVALGALAGTVATWAWLRPTSPLVKAAPIAGSASSAIVTLPAPPSTASISASSPQLPVVPAASEVGPSRPGAGRAGPRASAMPASNLSAEVSALDGVRTALSIGALHDAELQLAGYRRNFARGALRSEAEVLALELLVAQGRTQAAARAAERFVAQHPRDPQVARVRALVE